MSSVVVKFVAFIMLLYSANSFAMLTFDAQNFSQNIKMYGQHLKSLQELKQQTEYQIAQYRSLSQQLMIQKDNMKHLKLNTIKDLYNTYNETKYSLDQIKSITDTLHDLDQRYGDIFGKAEANPLPDREQNFLMQQHLKQSIASNKRAINSLKILTSQRQEQQKTQDLVNSSQQAAGQMQAMQSANQLAAMQIKQLQDLKTLMAYDLEQRSAAVAEENTARVIAHQRFQQEMAKPCSKYRGIKLPNLKKNQSNYREPK
jgi:type IV secretion system protein TrbJ